MKKTVVGLTGQSGAGKTTISDAFRKNGFEIINCDIVAREVTQAGNECCKELAKIFPDCFDDGFALDRRKLGEIVFSICTDDTGSRGGCNRAEKKKILN